MKTDTPITDAAMQPVYDAAGSAAQHRAADSAAETMAGLERDRATLRAALVDIRDNAPVSDMHAIACEVLARVAP